jgi:hypothetical protein
MTENDASPAPSAAAPPAPQPAPAASAPEPAAPAASPLAGWSLRRSVRTASSDSWDLYSADGERAGSATIQYAGQLIEGSLLLAGPVDDEARRGVLGWISDVLALDSSAGAGGTIHWVAAAGEPTDYWRQAPGRRLSGAENDLAVVRGRVESVLTSLFGTFGTLPDGDLAVDVGSVRVFVATRLVDAVAIVRVFAITNVDVPPDAQLATYLLSINFGLVVGRFSIDPSGRTVWFDHIVGGDEVSTATLARVITAIAATADRHDDEIKAKFGGRTFREEGSPDDEKVSLSHSQAGMSGGYI